ncbi:MAG TPA: tRNA (adenosine(37)-N6)-threonylcarbamoyltransferase complex ATPase subunit type 1 TsaE [Candidatus Saccharimonadales bacterium]|nr:tRNA (adenosine(37)-N6)-threonylcarbamoyltransferase complex ATPase subunit type 1 TsaE [Candidatus Saccharimonadales bacterium]
MDVIEADLPKLAEKIAAVVEPGDIIALSGPLGAGKTALTREVLRAMGENNVVSSPTFVLEHRYPVNWRGIKTVLHLDLYRLSEKDLPQFDWAEYLEADHQLTIIEWPEIAQKYLPNHTKTVKIEVIDAKTRRFQLPGALA